MKNIIFLLPFAAFVAGCTSVSSNYSGEITKAHASRIIVCHGHDCARKERLDITPADAQRFEAIMAGGATSAQAERRAVSAAVQYFEERSVQLIGVRDNGKSQFGPAQQPGQMDCIDEATNTQSLLLHLAERGLLKHHKVEGNVARGILLDARFPHATAVLRDTFGQKWAVDSWERDAGAPPEIILLKYWVGNGGLGEVIGGRTT